MPPLRRAVSVVFVFTAMAASLLHVQARAMTRAVEQRQLRLAQATALAVAGEELARAEAGVRAGRAVAGARHVDTEQGRLRVETATERRAGDLEQVRVTVADEQGRVLSRYETVVEVGR